MVSFELTLPRRLDAIYLDGADPAFENVVSRVAPATDADLADLIEADGRARIRIRLPVSLDRYLSAIQDLSARVEPLDAAIDVALRALTAQGADAGQAVRQLVGDYPALESAIREAAALSEAVISTSSLQRMLTTQPVARALPADFGPPLADGQRRYRLTALLGRGSGGEVYRATDRLLSEPGHDAMVAVKVLSGLGTTPWARQRFIEEATKARRIIDPHVVRVIDRGSDQTTGDYIVYEYVSGGDLQRFGAEHPGMSQHEVVRLVAGIAQGIQAAHAAGVVHCDLKPSNIVLTDEGAPKVADFGIAVRQGSWDPERAADGPGGPIGNLAFIAPEQYRMEPGAHTPAADLYAIGGIMYWLATGLLPNGRSLAEIERTHSASGGRTDAPSIRALRPEFDREIDLIGRRCMAPDPGQRYGSAAQLVEDLSAWMRREPVRWTGPSLRRVLGLWAQRKPGLVSSLAGLLLTIAAASSVSIVLWHRAAITDATLRAEEAERTKKVAALKLVLDSIDLTIAEGESWEMLPVLPYIEWAQGTSLIGDPTLQIPVWKDRIATIREMRAWAFQAGGANDFEALCLESTLAFWLVCDDQFDEASRLLAENRQKWTRLAPGFERWHAWLDAVDMCCRIGAVYETVKQDPGTVLDRDGLASSADRLVHVRDELTHGPSQRALQGLIDRTLCKLYGPVLLNKPELARPYQKHDKAKGSVLGGLTRLFSR